MQSNFKELLQKEMTRKEFLGVLGMAIASLLGFERIIKLLTAKSSSSNSSLNTSRSGYGK